VTSFEVKAIGRVESPLTDLESAPRQADEGAPGAWLVFEPEMLEGLWSLRPGDELIAVTWLHRARRDVLSVHPRGDTSRPQEGIFSTRSPHRPNPMACTGRRSPPSRVEECGWAISKCWTGRRSSKRAQHPVGHHLQKSPVLLETFRQPVTVIHAHIPSSVTRRCASYSTLAQPTVLQSSSWHTVYVREPA
jgi:tRNA-methyltransferase O